MKTLSSLSFFNVYIPSPIRPVTMKQHFLQENFMEMSEIHWENMFYPCMYTESSRLVNIS